MWPGFKIRLLPAREYKKNISFDRIRHNRSVAKAFAEEASRSDLPAAGPDTGVRAKPGANGTGNKLWPKKGNSGRCRRRRRMA
jgi:hypothetical protein